MVFFLPLLTCPGLGPQGGSSIWFQNGPLSTAVLAPSTLMAVGCLGSHRTPQPTLAQGLEELDSELVMQEAEVESLPCTPFLSRILGAR